jgi:nucleotide-binding universal stress UspA family protein
MLSALSGAQLSLLHVALPTESDELLQQDVKWARSRLQARTTAPLWQHGSSPGILVRSGSPTDVLMETARELDAALVVLGMHRKRPVRDALAGTIAFRLLSALARPLLIVRRMPLGAYRNVLLALDQSEASAQAVRAAEALVIRASARVSVVHAFQPPQSTAMTSAGIAGDVIDAYSDDWKRESEAGLRDLLTQVSRDASSYELFLENATTFAAVGNVIRRLNPDLLVLGTRGRSRLKRALLGSVANRIVAAARSDILIVPQRSARTASQRARSNRQGSMS